MSDADLALLTEIQDLKRRIEQLEDHQPQQSEAANPTFLTINPDGSIGAVFAGGLTLPIGPGGGQGAYNQILFRRTDTGELIGWLTDADTGHNPNMQLTSRASSGDTVDFLTVGSIFDGQHTAQLQLQSALPPTACVSTLQSQSGSAPNAVAAILAQANSGFSPVALASLSLLGDSNGFNPVLLDTLGNSDFVQARKIGGMATAAPVVLGRPTRLYRSAAYTSTAGVFNAGFFDVRDFDDDGNAKFSGGQWAFQAPAAGKYRFTFRASGPSGAGNRVIASIVSSNAAGAFIAELARGNDSSNNAALYAGSVATATLKVAAGAYVTGAVYTSAAMAMDVGASNMYFDAQQVA